MREKVEKILEDDHKERVETSQQVAKLTALMRRKLRTTPESPNDSDDETSVHTERCTDVGFSNQWWYPDSGASHHVTPDPSNVSESNFVPGTEQVFMGNGQGFF
ncbi:unnamed protein product [Vicia faba]|uniref:Uncharacterized protein n=1 Tax=Vicia faba TaxID=3906 RepID=A0AAV1B3L8_VICFA|nr:unnamed protein product [Vicia faba]